MWYIKAVLEQVEAQDIQNQCDPSGYAFQMFFIEAVCTAIFVSVILTVKYHTSSNEDLLKAITIGLTLYGMRLVAGPYTGAALNPAIGFINSLLQVSAYKNTELGKQRFDATGYTLSRESTWIYTLGPLLGGVIAGGWQLFHAKNLYSMKKGTVDF